ncbi:unnamed protein product [Penicillium glandicola]
MTVKPCVTTGCAKTGIWACSACEPPKAWYCSKECQKADFKVHKLSCAPTIPYNCFLIRASPIAGDNQPDEAYIEPFHLESYGNWGLEMKELSDRLGWPQADEAGKFYPQKNIDTWYYYMYQSAGQNLPENKLASRCLGRTVLGDVAVVRSSPADVDNYDESFTKMDLKKTVFQQRERSRITRKMGMPKDLLNGVRHFSFQG